jgi:organic hydroperoxide reductase OsmC/OhrA
MSWEGIRRMSATDHAFKARLTWQPQGLKFSYKEYSRLYRVQSEGKPDFTATAAPEYLGSKYHYNPEDLLVVALSACHMLTYLALASNSKIEILSYTDNADGILGLDGKVMKFKEVTLRPHIEVVAGIDLKKAGDLHDKAHHACFIANSVNFPIKVEFTFSETKKV